MFIKRLKRLSVVSDIHVHKKTSGVLITNIKQNNRLGFEAFPVIVADAFNDSTCSRVLPGVIEPRKSESQACHLVRVRVRGLWLQQGSGPLPQPISDPISSTRISNLMN